MMITKGMLLKVILVLIIWFVKQNDAVHKNDGHGCRSCGLKIDLPGQSLTASLLFACAARIGS